jgi:predicted DNA binding protein
MTEETVQNDEARQYRLTYRLDPPTGCPLGETDGTVSEFSVVQRGDTRRCELLVRHGDGTIEVESHARSTDGDCPCSVVIDNGVLPRFRSTGADGDVLLTCYVTGAEAAQTVTGAIESVTGDADLIDYQTLDESTRDWTVQIDLGSLTEKRREALERALADGYYETPSETTIDEMAARIGISSSAFATRLRKAEREVAAQIRQWV